MKSLALAALTLVTGLFATGLVADETNRDAKPQRLAIGSAMPAGKTEMESVDGKKYTLDGIAGEKGTLVIFSCNHCPYAVQWEERITKIGNEYKKKGFGVIVVNSNDIVSHPTDDMDHMKERAKKLGMEFPYAMDGDSSVAVAFGASKTPEVFLFDKAKKLAYWGAVDDNSADASAVKHHYLKDALDAVAEGKAPATAETKALGCGIKFRAAKKKDA
jgi:peroxiredoxin